MKIKCDPRKLPVPRLPPTRDIRTDDAEFIPPGSRDGFYTPAQDAVVKTMRAEGKSFREIAEQLGKSSESVRRRWHRLENTVQ